MRPTHIVGFSVDIYDLPLLRPFETAQARRTAAHNLLLTVELADGTRGFGEVAPAPHVTGEDQASSRSVLQEATGLVVGADVARYRRVSGAFEAAHPRAHAARAGLEAALLDAYCRHLGCPLFEFLGGAADTVTTDVTIPIVPPAEAGDDARAAAAEGYTDLKIKIGAGGEDFERVLAVAQAAPRASIRLDGNQGFRPDEAVSLLKRVQAAGVKVTLYEQPVRHDDLDGMRYVREHTDVPVAVDESVLTPEDAWRVVRAGAADVVNIKLMKAGVLGALEIAAICRAAGVRLMLGCMLESRLGISVAAHLAAGLGVFDFLDLDGHLLTADPRAAGGFVQAGGRLTLLPAAGHGVSVGS